MILNRQRAVRVARGPLEAFLRRIENEMDLGNSDVTVCLVSDAEIARMNQAFRKKKGPTDVLSFPAEKKLRTSVKRRKKIYTEDAEATGREEPRKPSIPNHADLSGGHCHCAFDGAALREKEWTKFEQ